MTVVLMVGEKPSIAKSIATCLSKGNFNTRKGVSPMSPVHEFPGVFLGKSVTFRVTSVTGHVFCVDFPAEFQSWKDTDPKTLFSAPIVSKESNPKSHTPKHLKNEAKGAAYLVLWLDCDREGENICFEVMKCTVPFMQKSPGKTVFRAKFSAVTESDLKRALNNLVDPNENEALSVDARQELDLKVGVAFTRFQTNFFHQKYGNLDSTVLSYGPCQTPTLWFCVDRYDKIQNFQPQNFWTLVPIVAFNDTMKGIGLKWMRKRVFDHSSAVLFEKRVSSSRAVLKSLETRPSRKGRPIPLNTVMLLKVCSSYLGLGPHQTMQCAERLYISGYISYPRTESTDYPTSYPIENTLEQMSRSSVWGEKMLEMFKDSNPIKAKKGVDAGDHPPITPTKLAGPDELGGTEWRIYEYICRHFIATVSPDCRFEKIKASFEIGGEAFKCSGKRVIDAGYTAIMFQEAMKDEGMDFCNALAKRKIGDKFTVDKVKLDEGKTSPPDFLTESELITKMEKHGIGTDASIPVHINTICERNYVQLVGNRQLQPTPTGITLIHGYLRLDPDLALPEIRSNIEKYIALIAGGEASFEDVVPHSLNVFTEKFEYFVSHIERMDQLFEASFNKIEETQGKYISKCGICKRYMTLITSRPVRLYCRNCEETYSVPQGGGIKLYQEKTCPLDGFELLIYTKGKQIPFCPYCYNNPPFETTKKSMSCQECTHPTCQHSLVRNAICPCPKVEEVRSRGVVGRRGHGQDRNRREAEEWTGERKPCAGTLVFIPTSGPKWRADCTVCNFILYFPEITHKVTPAQMKCIECGTTLMNFVFHKDKPPPKGLQNIEKEICLKCNDALNELCGEGLMRRKHGGRGRGRGRGGRRRGRGKGRGRGRGRR